MFALAACGSSSPSAAPSNAAPTTEQAPKLAGMSDDQRCAAVATRTLPCMDEVFNAQTMSMTGIDTSKSDLDERQKLHEIRCVLGPSYTDAIVTCWNERTCQAFALCVDREDQLPAKPPREQPEPMRLP
ncbi:MAG: hypothetical protein H0V17_07740 [Deltaproteobacteria bacterium]|nr:hypothetical protein [Deltaproteobacteria bacterium]